MRTSRAGQCPAGLAIFLIAGHLRSWQFQNQRASAAHTRFPHHARPHPFRPAAPFPPPQDPLQAGAQPRGSQFRHRADRHQGRRTAAVPVDDPLPASRANRSPSATSTTRPPCGATTRPRRQQFKQTAEKLLQIKLPKGTGNVGKVIETGQPLFFTSKGPDAASLKNMNTGFEVHSMLTVPLKTNIVIGAIQLLNKEIYAGTNGQFEQKDLPSSRNSPSIPPRSSSACWIRNSSSARRTPPSSSPSSPTCRW